MRERCFSEPCRALGFAALAIGSVGAQEPRPWRPPQVVWDSPSADASGSMPLGNGDIGLNVWVEPNGDLLFYAGKTDSWGDNGRLLKVGRLRVRVTPAPFRPGDPFEQRLDPLDASVNVAMGAAERAVRMRVWVDANHPLIQVEIDGRAESTAVAILEPWRTERYELPSLEVSDVLLDRSRPDRKHAPTVVEPDVVLEGPGDRIGAYHHNVKSVGPELTARVQGLGDLARADPLLHRTFGIVVTAEGARRRDDRTLESPAGTSHRFRAFVKTLHPSTPERWLAEVDGAIAAAAARGDAARRRAHERWWSAFWQRSFIRVTGREPTTAAPGAAEVVSRGYALQRFINACAGRGRYPIKFNGSIFTVPYPGRPGDADYRRWGPGYWWQNTRLPYLSMCAAGDFDLMQPLFRMYGEEVLATARARTRRYFGHGGAFFPECVYFWGDVFSETYGWQPFEERDDKLQASGWHKWEWVSGLELAFMMLEYHEYTGDDDFLARRALPLLRDVVGFFAAHYPTGDDGRLVMHPAQALETWWDCTNPMPEIAGLHAVLERLARLPDDLTEASDRERWAELRAMLPPLPVREIDGERLLAPAERFANKRNAENPELYAVFPFRRIAVGAAEADLELARRALEHRADRGNSGWRQDDVFMAYLGLADEARDSLVGRARNKDPRSRFPAFWGPNYDWVPDQDHGAVLMKALQAMLMQTDGRKIYVLPAWPDGWDATFRLHAPRSTTVEGEVEGGRLVRLEVEPASRRRDVVVRGGR